MMQTLTQILKEDTVKIFFLLCWPLDLSLRTLTEQRRWINKYRESVGQILPLCQEYLSPPHLEYNFPSTEVSHNYQKIVTQLCCCLPVIIRITKNTNKDNKNEWKWADSNKMPGTPRCNVKSAGALPLESNPALGSPHFPRDESKAEKSHMLPVPLTLSSSNTDTLCSLALTHVSNSGAPPRHAPAHNPCSSPASCCCHEVPTLSKYFHPCF